jgi:hypothetical protein
VAASPLKLYRARANGDDAQVSSPFSPLQGAPVNMMPYRERAEALRATAQSVSHADNKKVLLATADRYDQLATHLSVRPTLPPTNQNNG